MDREQIAFRCAGSPGRGPGCAPRLDERLAAYTGSAAAASLPPVFAPPEPTRLRIGRAPGRRAFCPECGQSTARRACPECHNPLPAAYCETPGKIVALVGAKNSGKSTYIAVLLHELSHRIGAELGTSLVACDDRTIERYKRDFHRPLFGERRLLPATASAVTTPRDPLVYLLTRTRRRHLRQRDMSLTLVLFDTAGKDLRSRDVTDLHLRYLAAADAIVFLIDPLELKTGEGDPDGDPMNVIARVTELLRAGRDVPHGRRLPVPAAVALTKVDALPLEGALQRHRERSDVLDLDDREAVHEQVRALLHDWQAGELDRYLGHEYAEYGLFGVSALGGLPRDGAIGAGGIRPYRVEDPLLWLLYRFGMLDGARG
ncbi:MAG: TRAFAC clade GTPase domain-containing protein [Actinoallomurus sp.]